MRIFVVMLMFPLFASCVEFGTQSPCGVGVKISPYTETAKQTFQKDDVLLQMGEVRIRAASDLEKATMAFAGQSVECAVCRNGERRIVRIWIPPLNKEVSK